MTRDEKQAKLRELWPSTLSSNQIAHAIGVSQSTVSTWRLELGLPVKSGRRIGKDGKLILPLTQAERDRIRALHLDGKGIDRIAIIVGRARYTVWKVVSGYVAPRRLWDGVGYERRPRVRAESSDEPPPIPIGKRTCLRCRQPFGPAHRLNFVCTKCRQSYQWSHDSSFEP